MADPDPTDRFAALSDAVRQHLQVALDPSALDDGCGDAAVHRMVAKSADKLHAILHGLERGNGEIGGCTVTLDADQAQVLRGMLVVMSEPVRGDPPIIKARREIHLRTRKSIDRAVARQARAITTPEPLALYHAATAVRPAEAADDSDDTEERVL